MGGGVKRVGFLTLTKRARAVPAEVVLSHSLSMTAIEPGMPEGGRV